MTLQEGQVRTELRTIARIAGQLGYGDETVRMWVRRADVDEGAKLSRQATTVG